MKLINYKILLILSFVFLSVSCSEKPQLPIADFSFVDNQYSPVDITFTNNSQFAEKYIWDFGDGKLSNEKDPVNNYYFPGTYTVKLTAYNSEGSAQKKESIRIKGTTYQVYNNCSFTMNEVIAFYTDGFLMSDFIGFGNMPVDSYSAGIHTTRTTMCVGFKAPNGKYFIISKIFQLYADQNNILEIHDYLEGFYSDNPIFYFD
jgi:PKD repeat protein